MMAVTAIGLAGCDSNDAPPAPEAGPLELPVAQPVVMQIVEWDEYTGRLDAIDDVEVRARVSGYLASTHFEEGQMVQKGDLLAIIDPRPFEAELNAAQAQRQQSEARLKESESLLRQAQAELTDAEAQQQLADRRYRRVEQLVQQNAIAQEEVDVRQSEQLQAAAAVEAAQARIQTAQAAIATAKASIETAQAQVESASLNLQYTQVRAPVGGRISRRLITEGNLISGGTSQSTLLTTIVSLNPIHVYFDANEQEFLKYVRLAREGKRASSRDVKNPVYVALVDEDGYPHRGHMDFVDNQVDPNTGTMRGRAILSNEDGLLTPGLFVKVRLPGSGRYDAVLIPDSAIGSDQTDKFVYVLNDEGGVQRQVVKTGPISHGLRIVRDGLDGSEQIVVSGLQQIRPGVPVKPIPETIEVQTDALPDNYQPVPREEWLSREPEPIPEDVPSNAAPYRAATDGLRLGEAG
ncbi:MAG: efflux RND transporter periplasmic adaptor subunit [Fuerstiella sp.]